MQAPLDSVSVVTGMLVQSAGLMVLTGIGVAAWRIYRRPYLGVLALAWTGLCLFQVSGSLTVLYGTSSSLLRLSISLLGSIAGHCHIAWILLGTIGLRSDSALTRQRFLLATGLAALLGASIWTVSLTATPDMRFFLRVSVRALLAAVAFLIGTAILLRAPRNLGSWLVAGGFVVYAANLLQYFALGLFDGASSGKAVHLGYVDILAQMTTGLGLVISMLEAERGRTLTAAASLQATHDQRVHSSKMEALGRMAGGVSHDFNNLLTAMRGHLELALERTDQNDMRRVDLEQAWRAAERACHLTQQLLSFSRARQVPAHETCDVVASLRELQPLLHRLVGPNVVLKFDLPARRLDVGIDRTGFEQIIFNLAANARDAMSDGGTLAFKVFEQPRHGTAPQTSNVVLEVTDTGHGMDTATRARIFDPFFTTKPPGMGTGLGLAQVYGIVQQARGEIDCASRPRAGTTFTITLPRETSTPRTPMPSPAPPVAVAANDVLRDQVVMLVDDDPLVRQLLCRSLREHGYTVIEAGDPVEALTLESEFDERIDLLITDLAMPRLSGGELAQRITARRPDVQVLYITGFSAAHTPSPDVELLQKPFAQETFLGRVEKILGARGRQRAPDPIRP